jgi:hypothetical protein
MPTRKLVLCAALAVSVASAPAIIQTQIQAQSAPPAAYTITQAIQSDTPGVTSTLYRSGSKALQEVDRPAQGSTPASKSFTLYDLTAGSTISWDPAANPPACGAGRFSGDWGDPFAMTAEVNDGIAKGDLKPAGTETLAGIPAEVYAASSAQGNTKVWLDKKDGLVLRAVISGPGTPAMTLADIRKISFAPPPASLFAVPPACAGVKPPPTPAEVIAEETGDDPANYANGNGPGSKNSCSVVLKVVQAKTLTPITQHTQVAIDTSMNETNPPRHTYGVGQDGTVTYSGGNIMEITNRVHNGVARLGIPPAYFELDVNVVRPGHAGWYSSTYRQCFAPTQVLLYVVKDLNQPSESVDILWVKSGKQATP